MPATGVCSLLSLVAGIFIGVAVGLQRDWLRKWRKEKVWLGRIQREWGIHRTQMGKLIFAVPLSWRWILLRRAGLTDADLRGDEWFDQMYAWLDSRRDVWARMDEKFPVDYVGQWEGPPVDDGVDALMGWGDEEEEELECLSEEDFELPDGGFGGRGARSSGGHGDNA